MARRAESTEDWLSHETIRIYRSSLLSGGRNELKAAGRLARKVQSKSASPSDCGRRSS